jgi:hypothetical protein
MEKEMEKDKTNRLVRRTVGLVNLLNLMADADLLADVRLPDMDSGGAEEREKARIPNGHRGDLPAGRYAISHISDDGTRVALEDPADCELYVVSVTDLISAIMDKYTQ